MRYAERRLLELAAPMASSSPEKACTRCGKVKPMHEFSRHKQGAHGRQARCKACLNAISKQYSKRERGAPLRPDACDCCKQVKTLRQSLHWDRDADGQFRGWLCVGCRAALGSAGSVEHLEQLIAYLKRGGGPA